MKNYRKIIIVFITIFTCLIFVSFSNSNTLAKLKSLSYIIKLVENYYVDEVDLGKTLDGAIHGFLDELDPHSSYINSEDFQYMHQVHLQPPLVNHFSAFPSVSVLDKT